MIEKYSDEVVTMLMDLSPCSFEFDDNVADELDDALFHLKTIAENKYNQHYWITLWNVLCTLAD